MFMMIRRQPDANVKSGARITGRANEKRQHETVAVGAQHIGSVSLAMPIICAIVGD
jgi:hypothetical protein